MIKIKPKMKIDKVPLICLLSTIFLLLFLAIGFSVSSILENDVEVKPKTDLIYYLNVNYDGVDRMGIESSDTTMSEVSSGLIHVEDKIPEGLIFNGFVTTEDGSIGAVSRSTGVTCSGKVVDNTDGTETLNSYHGLYYDEETRTVSFDVKNLKAGCVLTVGIKTITPTIDDPNTIDIKETRRDFYNFATFKEGNLTGKSNTVHTWMGREDLTMYKVIYKYEGIVPSNAPTVPDEIEYASGSQVGVASNVNVEGYEFSGWKTEDATVTSGSFKMPENDVVFVGNFKEIPKYQVSYEIKGTKPDGYIEPSTKEYYPLSNVTIDSLKAGDVFNGYRFMGWKTEEVDITNEGDFSMPSHNVLLVGEFEEVRYKVTYEYFDTVIPYDSNGNRVYPPKEETYKPGEIVKLPVINDVPGYTFLGWYKDDNFTMPEKDITIYGEWKVQLGTFEPTITKEIINTKDYYQPGDIVKYKITVTNTANFEIKSITVKENNDNAYFVDGSGYDVVSTHNVRIDSLNANSSVIIYAEYKVTKIDQGTIKNEVEITGALASNKYELKQDGNYKDDASFKVKSRVKVCKNVDKISNTDDKFQFNITGNSYDSWLALENNECGYVYVVPGTYSIKEVIPQDYSLKEVTGSITSNGEYLNVEFNKSYSITFTNKYEKFGFFHSVGRVVNKIRNAFNLD